MRKSRRHLSIVTGLLSAIVVVSGCGPTNILSGLDAKGVISKAADNLPKTASSAKFNLGLKLDKSHVQGLNLTDPTLQAYGPLFSTPTTISGDIAVESDQRQKLHVDIASPGVCTGKYYAVNYDGSLYTSTDDAHYAAAGSSNTSSGGSSTESAKLSDELKKIANADPTALSDKGSDGSHGGDDHIVVTIDTGLMTAILSGGSTSNPSVVVASILPLLGLNNSSADIWVSQSTADLTEFKSTINLALDLGAIAQAASVFPPAAKALAPISTATGTLAITFTAGVTLDYSGGVTVTKPSPSSGASGNPCGAGDALGANGHAKDQFGSIFSIVGGGGTTSSGGGSSGGGGSGDTSSASPTQSSGSAIDNVFSNVSNGLSQ